MDYTIHEEEYKGLTIRIEHDPLDAPNPLRDFDCYSDLVTVVCFHSRYDLGTENHGFRDPDEVWEYIRKTRAVALPLYLYEHSGISMSCSNGSYPFNCPWDAGMVGIAFIERDKLMRQRGHKIATKKDKEWARDFILTTISEYDLYLRGESYGFVIEDEKGEHLDSCWGFLTDEPDGGYLLEEARETANSHVNQRRSDHFERLKTWIKNNVPLCARECCPA